MSNATALFDKVARRILAAHPAPDLRGITVLLPNMHTAQPLAQALMRNSNSNRLQCEGEARRRQESDADSTGSTARSERGSQHRIADAVEAVLLPQMVTLNAWAQSVPLEMPLVSDSQRSALLYQLLRDKRWFDNADLWSMAQELLKLFDELTYALRELPGDADTFVAAVEHAYQARQNVTLQLEARLVFELWHAMQEGSELDAARAYQQRLAKLAQQADRPLYVLRASEWDAVEQRFLEEYEQRAMVKVFDLREMVGGAPFPTLPPEGEGLDLPLPAGEGMREGVLFFAATSLEQEARAAAMQVRLWLQAGKQNIAIVAQDRVVARRMRALLERAEVLVADETGWTFATMAVSTVLDRWLTALQSDFYHHDLLDLLKSPFIFADMTASERKSAVYQLEQLLRKQGVVAGLDKFSELTEHEVALHQPLARLRQALALMEQNKKKTLAAWLAALRESLNVLSVDVGLQQDDAGQQLLRALDTWQQELNGDAGRYAFHEWRRWLAQQLDIETFRDSSIDSTVCFTHLAATRWRDFDAVLLLGCDADHLPSAGDGGRWFNDAVRSALNLPTRAFHATRQRDDLLALLAMNDTVLVTWQRDKNGEARLLSPFLQMLREGRYEAAGHPPAYPLRVLRDELNMNAVRAELVEAQESVHISTGSMRTDPVKWTTLESELHAYLIAEEACLVSLSQSAQPAPSVARDTVPPSVSISGYNSLVACPYQFYARHILRLNELDEVQETIEKRDYGERVHAILQRFHEQYLQVNGHDMLEMEAALRRISAEVFADLLAQDFAARAWLARWYKSLPAYIEWQAENEAQGWRYAEAEKAFALELDGVRLRGRIDRLDGKAGERKVFDYKTQSDQVLRNKLKEAGEDVQLACYAHAEQASEAAFVSIENGKVKTITPPHDLAQLAQLNAERLEQVMAAIRGGAGLPANGIDAACMHCEVRGVCRKGEWGSV